MESKHTEKLIDETKDIYMFAALRTYLDPASDEWEQTTLSGKLKILKKLLAHGNTFQEIIVEYKAFYIEIKKVDVAKQVTDGLIELLNYLIDDQTTNCVVSNC